MTNESIQKLIKHFCLDSVDLKSPEEVVLFPPQSLKSVVLINFFGKTIVNSLEDTYEELKGLTSIEDMIKKLEPKTQSYSLKKYYFVDNKTPLKKKIKKNVEVLKIKNQSDLDSIALSVTDNELDEAYVSLLDVNPMGAYESGVLKSACSLIKIDDVYDFGIITHGKYRSKKYARVLMYNYLRENCKDKLIRIIVDDKNACMKKVCESLGIKCYVEFVEVLLK